MHTAAQFKQDLMKLGLRSGDTVMIHSSYKALGGIEGGAAAVICALKEVVGPEGTLIFPAFSWVTVNSESPVFDRETTPGCVGYLPEYFRTQVPRVIRSIHATHSCCLWGKRAEELAKDHELDDSPVGPNSPLAKLPKIGGKILMLGCPFDRNTSMHGVEETADPIPVYLLHKDKLEYTLKDGEREIRRLSRRHNFYVGDTHYIQCYRRVIDLLEGDEVSLGKVLDANCALMDAAAVWKKGRAKLQEEPLYFVDTEKV